MEKRIYKLMDAKGRVLIPKELRVETGIGYGDIVALEIADGKVTLRKVTVIEPGDQSPETVEAFVRAAFRTMPDRLRLSLISDLSGLLNEEKRDEQKGTGRCRDPTGPEEKTINEKKGKDDGKRKKDGCETSRNRQKKETGKRNRIVLLAGAGIVAAALLTGGLMHGCREKSRPCRKFLKHIWRERTMGWRCFRDWGRAKRKK